MKDIFKKATDRKLSEEILSIEFIDPKNELPKTYEDCLLRINLKGWAAGYYDDVYIYMSGKYNQKKEVWEYFDMSGDRYPVNKDCGVVVGWRYIDEW